MITRPAGESPRGENLFVGIDMGELRPDMTYPPRGFFVWFFLFRLENLGIMCYTIIV